MENYFPQKSSFKVLFPYQGGAMDNSAAHPDDLILKMDDASQKLALFLRSNPFPELEGSLVNLAESLSAVKPTPGAVVESDSLVRFENSIERLYRTSSAQTNASPQKYQQPIFQCHSDYLSCVKQQKSGNGKLLCMSLFVLSLANNLLSITIKLGSK